MNMKLLFSMMTIGSAAIVAAATPGDLPRAAEITRTHGFKEARLCTFQSGGEKLFDELGTLRYKRSLRLKRKIGGLDLAIDGRRTSRPDPSGGFDAAEATTGTPLRPIRMHGLQVRSFAVGSEQHAESDGLGWREVRLKASPERVRGMLGKLGVKVPARGYHSIDDEHPDGHPCGGAISIKGGAGETSIRCEWGC